MWIKNAHIENFKGIKSRDFEFKPGFNLIKGGNGKGKTSILEALAVGLGGFIAGVPNVATRHFQQNDIRREYRMIGDGSCSCKHHVPIEVSLTAAIEPYEQSVTWTRKRNNTQESRSTIQPREIAHIAEWIANQEDAPLPFIGFQGAGRIWSQKREKSQNPFGGKFFRTAGYKDALQEASNIKLLLNWCVRMEQIAWQKGSHIAEYEAVKSAVSDFMSYMNHGNEYRVFYDKQLEDLLYQENQTILPVTDLSAGYQSLIWMVFDIAYRMAVLNPFLLDRITETTGIVLVDELDMHLHPKWQWRVIDALRRVFPNVQFIATTHAPILFASAKDVWLIDIEHEEAGYCFSHFGLDVNSSLESYQGEYDLPESVRVKINQFEDAMDAEDYAHAKQILDWLDEMTAPEYPLIAGLRARYEIETMWPEE